jgi:hypothetical protein
MLVNKGEVLPPIGRSNTPVRANISADGDGAYASATDTSSEQAVWHFASPCVLTSEDIAPPELHNTELKDFLS